MDNDKLKDVTAEYLKQIGASAPARQVPVTDIEAAHQAVDPQVLAMQQKMQALYQKKNQIQQAMDAKQLDERDIPQAQQMLQDLDTQIGGIQQPQRFQKLRQTFNQ